VSPPGAGAAPPRVTLCFGTRPEAIKMAPVVRAFRADGRFATRVVVTGQHRQMLDAVLAAFDIAPDADLDVMTPDQTLAGLTARTLTAFDAELVAHPADLVLVQGDTTAAFAAGLAAFYRRTPVGHVEAGLRTGDLSSPWPEEANRVLLTRLAALHFAPTAAARDNLLWDGVPADRIRLVGNTVDIQALTRFIRQLEQSAFLEQVQLVKSEHANDNGKDVTQFQLDMLYTRPDPALVRRVPLAVSVR